MAGRNSDNKVDDKEKPPVLSSWNRLYAAVLLLLAFLILLFSLFTEAFD
jgi:hypothetical protein